MGQARRARAINQRKKLGSVTYRTDRENEVSKIFIFSLRLIGRAGKETEVEVKCNLAGRTLKYGQQY